MKNYFVIIITLMLGAQTGPLMAGPLTIPNIFVNATPANAVDVNANFSAAETAVDDNDARITTNTGNISGNSGSITTNNTAISGNATSIGDNSTNIGTNTTNITANSAAVTTNDTDISNNTTAIGTKQNRVTGTCATGSSIRAISSTGTVTCETDSDSGGDITEVIAGSGISVSGGTSGTVTVSIPTSGITSTHIGPSAVGTSEVANGSLFDIDIADEAGLDYSGHGYYDIINLTNCNATTTIASVSVTAPTSGYILVSSTGRFCTYPAGVWTWIMLDNAPGGTSYGWDGQNYRYDYSSTFRACGIGQYTQWAFQNAYYVPSSGTYNYYLKGCTSTSAGDGNLNYNQLIGLFLPTRY